MVGRLRVSDVISTAVGPTMARGGGSRVVWVLKKVDGVAVGYQESCLFGIACCGRIP